MCRLAAGKLLLGAVTLPSLSLKGFTQQTVLELLRILLVVPPMRAVVLLSLSHKL